MTKLLVLMSVEIYIIFDLKQCFRKRDFSSPLLSTWRGLPLMFFKITCKVNIFIILFSVIVYGQAAGPNDVQSFLQPTRLFRLKPFLIFGMRKRLNVVDGLDISN